MKHEHSSTEMLQVQCKKLKTVEMAASSSKVLQGRWTKQEIQKRIPGRTKTPLLLQQVDD